MAGRKLIRAAPHARVGDRLKAARIAHGYEVLESYAAAAGIPSNQYGQYETGVRRITVRVALILKCKFGLSLDYIYAGGPMLATTLADERKMVQENTATYRTAMSMVREVIEAHAPPGSMPAEEDLPPGVMSEAEAQLKGILAIARKG